MADPSSSRPAKIAQQVVLVGAGAHARAWLALLRRSARLSPVACVHRGTQALAPDLPRSSSLPDAMREHPQAAFAVALPPRAGLEAALLLAAAGRSAVLQAPLDDALIDAEIAAETDAVRVAHGWVTLGGLAVVAKVMKRFGGGRLHIELAGVPEADHCDLSEGLVHAAALVRALLPLATVVTARQADGGTLEAEFSVPSENWQVELRLRTRGQRLAVRVEATSSPEPALWSWQGDRESVLLGDVALLAPRAAPLGAARSLAQLLPSAPRGDGLVHAAAALRLARACRGLLSPRLVPGARSLTQAASIAQRRPEALLDRLGLRGELTPARASSAAASATLRVELPPEPFELWAFRAGIKPVAFLTVRPRDVDQTLAYFGDVAHQRRERRVRVESQDRWTDRRDQGEPRVELYISRDAALAERAAHLQAEVDPTRAIRDLGALVGYPPCCVEAFAQQDDRANNSRNRYSSWARSLGGAGSAAAPWPWQLNNLHTMVVPFYPCSYRCESALAWARASLTEMALVHADLAAALAAVLRRPVLYFDHDHQLIFDGEVEGDRVAYRSVVASAARSRPMADLVAAVAGGDCLTFDDSRLLVESAGRAVFELERTDPALGFVAPFGDAA